MREPMIWAKTPEIGVQALATIIFACAGVAYLGWERYAEVAVGFYVVLAAAFETRWRGSEDHVLKNGYMAAAWPLTVVLAYKIVGREEWSRKDRIVRDVMES